MDKIALISGSPALFLVWLVVRFLQGSRDLADDLPSARRMTGPARADHTADARVS